MFFYYKEAFSPKADIHVMMYLGCVMCEEEVKICCQLSFKYNWDKVPLWRLLLILRALSPLPNCRQMYGLINRCLVIVGRLADCSRFLDQLRKIGRWTCCESLECQQSAADDCFIVSHLMGLLSWSNIMQDWVVKKPDSQFGFDFRITRLPTCSSSSPPWSSSSSPHPHCYQHEAYLVDGTKRNAVQLNLKIAADTLHVTGLAAKPWPSYSIMSTRPVLCTFM